MSAVVRLARRGKLRWLRRKPIVTVGTADYFADERPDVAEVIVRVRVSRPSIMKHGLLRVRVRSLSGLVGRHEYIPSARWCFGDRYWSWDSEALSWMDEQRVTPEQVEQEIELDHTQLEQLYKEAKAAKACPKEP